jgi:subtilisin family serine protease
MTLGRWLLLFAIVGFSLPAIGPVQVVAWFVGAFVTQTGNPVLTWVWPAVTWALLALPTGLALVGAVWIREPAWRSLFTTWSVAGLIGAVLALTRLSTTLSDDIAPLLQLGLSVLVLGLLIGWFTVRRRPLPPGTGLALSLAGGLAVLGPFVTWGATGSPGEWIAASVASLTTGLALGLAVFGFGQAPLDPASQEATSFARAAGLWIIALALALAGPGQYGSQLLYTAAPIGLGLLCAAVATVTQPRAGWAGPGLTIAIGLMAVAWFDPEELSLYLMGDGVISAALAATMVSALTAGLLAAALWGAKRARLPVDRPWAGAGLLLVAVVTVALVYAFVGRPGWYGERLLVVLRTQPDVRAALDINDRDTRLAYVYETLTREAKADQVGLRRFLDELGIAYTPYYLVNAIEVHDNTLLLRWVLAARPDVDRVLDSQRLRPQVTLPEAPPSVPEPAPGLQWNLTELGVDRVWREYEVRGAGIIIGQSDSGVDGTHEALAGQYRGSQTGSDNYNWLDPWSGSRNPIDIGGHGTHTLGTVLGAGGIGVAPEATWFGCRNLARNLGNPALYLDCLQFMLAPYPQGGDPFVNGDVTLAAHVLNNSWGCPDIEGCDPFVLQPAATALHAAGIFVVVSAGNSGPNCGSVDGPLANYADVFSVGAVDAAGDLATFSSRGPARGTEVTKPDLVAPGVDILSSLPGGGYGANQGTSMAGPHVAGVVALMWSANPALIGDVDQTSQILRETARPLPNSATNLGCPGANNSGAGLVDAYAAVTAARTLATSP